MKVKYLLLVVFFLSSCSEFENPGELLIILTSQLDEVYVKEDYNFGLQVTGGLRPYHFELEEGQLPKGLQLDDNGRIYGTANQEGNYELTIVVSDANLSKTFKKLNLSVTKAPPARLEIKIPETEMREEFNVRIEIKNARSLQAFRTILKWDSSRFEFVAESLRRNRSKMALLRKVSKGSLQVDIAMLGESFNGNSGIFEFGLRPLSPNTVKINSETEFLAEDNKHDFSELEVGSTQTNNNNGNDNSDNSNETNNTNETNSTNNENSNNQ